VFWEFFGCVVEYCLVCDFVGGCFFGFDGGEFELFDEFLVVCVFGYWVRLCVWYVCEECV